MAEHEAGSHPVARGFVGRDRDLADLREHLAEARPRSHGLPGPGDGPGGSVGDDARTAMFERMVDELRGASADVSRLLVLDDVQWADPLFALELVGDLHSEHRLDSLDNGDGIGFRSTIAAVHTARLARISATSLMRCSGVRRPATSRRRPMSVCPDHPDPR